MGMIRQYTPNCDVPRCYEAGDWGEWTSAYAAERAKSEGWHIRGNVHICPVHWAEGWNFARLKREAERN